MTNKQTLDGVSRTAIQFAIERLDDCQNQAFQSCECEECEQCGEMPDKCSGTECAKTCQCITCDHCSNKAATEELRALLDKPVSQSQSEPMAVEFLQFEFTHDASGEKRVVRLTKDEVFSVMEDDLFEKISESVCDCEPVGETNVVDCGCESYIDGFSLSADQPQGEPIYQVMYRGDGGGGWSDAEKASYDVKTLHPNHWMTRIVYATQPQGEVERLRRLVDSKEVERQQCIEECSAEVGALRDQLAERNALLREIAGLDPRGEFLGWQLDGKIDAILSTSAEPKPATGHPNRLCHIDYATHPYHCGCLKGDDEAQRRFDEHHGKANAELKPRGEPVAWASPESLGGIRWRPQALDGLADGAPLYCRPPEQAAPLATEAAKAFAKGFNTLESGSGKYRINMQFQSREDAWGAFNMLARLKQLNTPQ